MTYKQYLRKVEKLERAGDSESLAALETELMENLDSNLDMAQRKVKRAQRKIKKMQE